MITSMTAFARVTGQGEWGSATWEVRSVNHRHLDLSFKISDNFREWEQNWRHLAAKSLHRGKVDCYLTYVSSRQTRGEYRLNQELVDELVSNCQAMMQYPGVSEKLSALDLLRWPEALTQLPGDLSLLESPLTALLDKALSKLVEVRQQEGKALAQFIVGRMKQSLIHLEKVRKFLPASINAQKQKIMQKLSDIQASVDPHRLEQEFVFYAQRMDVEEEMDRFETHANEVIRVIEAGGPVGRRLDFLMQELGREANTLSAKSLNLDVTQEAIELKVLIEQMREQIQNVE